MSGLWIVALVVGALLYNKMGWFGFAIPFFVVALMFHLKNLYWKWLHRW